MIIPVVAACIVDANEYGRVLLTKRYSEHDEINNRWEFPGGVVENGESLVNALAREIKEELGLAIDVKMLLHAQINKYDYSDDSYLVMFFECWAVGPINEANLPEHKWVTLSHIADFNPLPGAILALRNL